MWVTSSLWLNAQYTASFYSHTLLSDRHCYYSVLWLRELRHRLVKQIAQGHSSGKWQGQDFNPGSLAPEYKLLTTHYCSFSRCMSRLCPKFWRSPYYGLSFPVEAYFGGYSHAQYLPSCLLWLQKCSRNNLNGWVRAYFGTVGVTGLFSGKHCKEKSGTRLGFTSHWVPW